MALVLLICVGGIVCLTPLAVYLRWVGAVNRRNRPTVVHGTWDFVALLAGLSGFLMFGGGVLVAMVQSNARILFRGNHEQLDAVASAEWYAWAVTAAGYLFVLFGAVGLTVLSRSRALSVYNVTRTQAAAAVEAGLADLGVTAVRTGDLWSDGTGLVEIQPFDGFHHVIVWFVTDDVRRRQDIERTLRSRFAAVAAADNPATPYLVVAATTVACAAVSFVVMIAYLVYVTTR